MLKKRIGIILLSQAMLLGTLWSTAAVSVGAASSSTTTLTFSNTAITETVSGKGYGISGTTLTITAAGVYHIKGSCSEGSIVVNKGLSDVVLVLDGLSLTSSSTAPVVVKKESSVTIHLDGTSTLTDNEDASTKDTNEDFEGAAIKVKSGSTVTFCGDGTLNVNGNAYNGIKGAAESTQIYNGGTYRVNAANNGIAADGSLVFNAGSFTVDADNDGIKSVPEADDTASVGSVTINNGTFKITSDGDAIQADSLLQINNGSFTLKTMNGYQDSSFNEDTMSAKGLKASGDRESVTNQLAISGGTFYINTADDAIHSDATASITGGTFTIYTGDDGVHADTQLDLGVSSGLARDPEFNINASYEGLESGVVNMYSGKYWVVASDDGINAAGGSSNGSDPGAGGGGDSFKPGGQPGGRPGGQGGGQSGGQGSSTSSNYSLNIFGGSVYVNALGDGLDSNGALNLTGGDITVMSMASGGDNSPLDCDGTITLNGATVFAAGTNPMNENPSTSTSQSYYKQTNSLSAGTVVTVKNGSTTLYSDTLLRNINYLLYSTPSVSSSSISVSTGGSVDTCHSNAFAHNWNSGTTVTAATATSTGKIKYTCQSCGAVEYKTIPMTVNAGCDGHDDVVVADDEGYAVTFSTDGGATINVYHTQDYTKADETSVTKTVSRNSDSGDPDSTGEGQVNFTVVPKSGYEVDSVTVSGGYKNLKNVSTDTLPNTYRVTKVTSDLTITVTTKKTSTAALALTASLSSSSITLGKSTTITAAATGGSGSYTYAFYYKKASSSSWTTAQAYSSAKTATITPASATTYDICVKVKDSTGTIAKQYATLTVSKAALTNNATLSATSITLGKSVTVTASASGGSGSYTYGVYYKKSTSSTWSTAQSYSSNKTVTITPASATTYDICVKVKDTSGTITKKYFTLTVTASALSNTSKLTASSITLGNCATAKASATGGSGSYTYGVYYKKATSSTWTTAQSYSTNAVVSFKPASATTYDVCIKVKDSKGTIAKKYLTLTVTK